MNHLGEARNLVEEVFPKYFSHQAQTVVCAPGRVNIIGEHTDYNDGFVLPAAIQFYTAIAVSPRTDSFVEAVALDHNAQRVRINLQKSIVNNKDAPWSDYLAGVLQEFQKHGFTLSGMNLLISGNVPQGAGLSSSASFEIAIAAAINTINQLGIHGRDAALIGQAAENNFVGCRCGIMDQLVSAMGKKEQAMLLDCRSLEPTFYSIPADLRLLIINSNVKRGLVGSEYNLRRQQCEDAAAWFEVSALRDISIEQLKQAEGKLDETVYKRARHVVTENQRTIEAAKAMAAGDVKKLSRLMAESHQSMRDDFAITVPAIDTLVEIVSEVLGSNGGVRMTGGGFGGCVVALVPLSFIHKVTEHVAKEYEKRSGLQETVYICEAADGGFADS